MVCHGQPSAAAARSIYRLHDESRGMHGVVVIMHHYLPTTKIAAIGGFFNGSHVGDFFFAPSAEVL